MEVHKDFDHCLLLQIEVHKMSHNYLYMLDQLKDKLS